MADGKQWYKVWTSILTDPSLSFLHNQSVGCWVRLCALTAQHGTNGKLTISQHQLLVTLHLSNATQTEIDAVFSDLKTLNIVVNEEVHKGSVTLVTLQISNWGKYQAYSESYERVNKFRKSKPERYKCNVEKKRREEKRREENKKRVFIVPTLEEIEAYCKERKNNVNPKKWLSHYQAKNWFIGKNKMVDWEAAVRTWEEDGFTSGQEADREKLKRDLKQAYQELEVKRGYLDSMGDEDPRRSEYTKAVEMLNKKIDIIEKRINT